MRSLPPLFSVPTSRSLAALVSRNWDVPGPVRCDLWFAGINAIYKVAMRRGAYFLRVPRRGLDVRACPATEGALLAHLKERGCDVVVPVRARSGGFTVTVPLPEGSVEAVLFERVDGEEVFRPNPAQAGASGRALARIHAAADSFQRTSPLRVHDPRFLVDYPLARLRGIGLSPDALRGFSDAARRFRRRLAVLPRSRPGWGIVHGDAIPTNVRLMGNPPRATWYDFEFSGTGWRAYDIASFRHFQLYAGWNDKPARAAWRAFLLGYASVRPLAGWERRALPLFVAVRQFWVTGIHAWFADQYGHRFFGPDVLAGRLVLLKKLARSL